MICKVNSVHWIAVHGRRGWQKSRMTSMWHCKDGWGSNSTLMKGKYLEVEQADGAENLGLGPAVRSL